MTKEFMFENLVFSENVRGNLTCWGFADEYCNTNRLLAIPDQINNQIVDEIGKTAFYERKDVKTVAIGNNIVRIGKLAFANSSIYQFRILCNHSRAVPLTIETSVFEDCSELTHVWGFCPVIMEGKVFKNCSWLSNLDLPFQSIASQDFYGCNQLSVLMRICDSCKIDDNAFEKCDNIYAIRLEGKVQCSDVFLHKFLAKRKLIVPPTSCYQELAFSGTEIEIV